MLTLAQRQRRVGSSCAAGSSIRVINPDGTVACETDDDTTSFWGLTGNTVNASNWLGTSNNQALELRVNGQRALRLAPNATSPNLIGGHSGNWVSSGVEGAAISGGGSSNNPNRVTDDYGTVSGGLGNQAGDNAGTDDDVSYATVGGGLFNKASRESGTVGGGLRNAASGYIATVGGGNDNTASGDHAIVGGEGAIPPADFLPQSAGEVATPPARTVPRSAGGLATPPVVVMPRSREAFPT